MVIESIFNYQIFLFFFLIGANKFFTMHENILSPKNHTSNLALHPARRGREATPRLGGRRAPRSTWRALPSFCRCWPCRPPRPVHCRKPLGRAHTLLRSCISAAPRRRGGRCTESPARAPVLPDLDPRRSELLALGTISRGGSVVRERLPRSRGREGWPRRRHR